MRSFTKYWIAKVYKKQGWPNDQSLGVHDKQQCLQILWKIMNSTLGRVESFPYQKGLEA